MRGQNNRVVFTETGYKISYLDYLLGVKTDGRLIKNKYIRVAYKRLGKAYTLTVALRQVLYKAVLHIVNFNKP